MIKIGTDFSGIGSPEQALKNLGIKHDVEFACEIDKYARQSYLANHDCKVMYEDITIREHSKTPQLDLYVAGFPCQAFSLAGKRMGFEEARGTLFFNVAEFIKINQPKAFILENVKGLLSHDNGKTFQTIISILSDNGGTVNGQTSIPYYDDGLGYHIYYQVLNTKEHGIPQNRERVFIVGFKEPRNYRFPMPEPLKLKLKDVLEGEVDEKYFLSDKMIKGFIKHKERHEEKGNGFAFKPTKGEGVAVCISTANGSRNTDNYILKEGFINKDTQAGQVISDNGVSSSLCSGTHGYAQGYVKVNSATKIRRLTPLECFRLQGFPDYFKKVVSDTQLYKQAGNSITVNVIQKVIQRIYE